MYQYQGGGGGAYTQRRTHARQGLHEQKHNKACTSTHTHACTCVKTHTLSVVISPVKWPKSSQNISSKIQLFPKTTRSVQRGNEKQRTQIHEDILKLDFLFSKRVEYNGVRKRLPFSSITLVPFKNKKNIGAHFQVSKHRNVRRSSKWLMFLNSKHIFN